MARRMRVCGGAALVTMLFLAGAIVTSGRAAGHEPPLREIAFSNGSGVAATAIAAGSFDGGNAFFDSLGTNGRTCFTCHRPAQAWTITPGEVTERFEKSAGLDPLFRTNDGSNCEGADVSGVDRRRAFSLLLEKGLIRVGLEVPPEAEFDIVGVDDPYRCGAPLTTASMYRRPLPTSNLRFLSAVMWDGRASVPGHGVRDDLVAQALDATVRHSAGRPPSLAQLQEIVDLELGITTAQVRDRAAGSLSAAGARGGLDTIARQPFCVGVNDPLRMRPSMPGACLAVSSGFDPIVFSLFGAWEHGGTPAREAIARGETIFNTRQFAIDNVPGLNGGPGDPVAGPIQGGTCTMCHDTPNAGNHSVAMALNIGIADPSRRAPDLPLYTLRNRTTGDLVQSTDPGRAMVTGRWQDIGKFKGPILRALGARPPYFHDGSAASLADVVAFYETRFHLRLTAREKFDLIAFLGAL